MSERKRRERKKFKKEWEKESKKEMATEPEMSNLTCECDNITVCSMAPNTAHSKIKFCCQ